MLVRGINSAVSCRYRYVDANTNIKQTKQLLKLLNQNNAVNIPYDGENREPVQLITEFFINEAISNVEEGVRLIGGAKEHNTSDCGDELEDTTPSVTACGAHSSVEIQNNAGSSFLITDAAASFACKCSQIKTAEGAELKVEQRWGYISQFSVKSDNDVVAFQLNIYNTIYSDKTLLITLYGKQKSTWHACLLSFVLVCI